MPQAIKISEVNKGLKKILKDNRFESFATVKQSRKDVVVYVDYLNTKFKDMKNILEQLKSTYTDVEAYGKQTIPDFSSSTTSIRVLIGKGTPRPVVNFRSYKIGSNAPTQVQEAGSSFILQQVLNNDKVFNSAADIENDVDTFEALERLFNNYESSLGKWLYTYYQQQKQFLAKYKSSSWKEFKYGDGSFVDLFETYIKEEGLYSDFEKGIKVQKYTEWNPSDIYAVKNPKTVKTELDKIFKKKNKKNKGAHLGRLNAYLIELIDKKQLVGLSLKQIKDNMRAILEVRNTERTKFKDPHIEDANFNMNDIKFQIDNIHIKQTVTTYVKFGTKFSINISSSSSNYGNLTYATQITGASAQGGNAPVAFVNDLIREKGSGYTFTNNNKEYPRTNEEFLDPSLRSAIQYDEKDYEKWFKFVKKFFKKPDNNSKSYDQFHEYISGLYQQKFSTGGPPCAQTKLMTLHFFYDTLRTYSKDQEFWLRVLYLGMKVGERFAAHAKIYESGDKEEE